MSCLRKFALVVVVLAVVVAQVLRAGPNLPVPCWFGVGCPKVTIGGQVAPGYEFIRDMFEKHFNEGMELGAQVVAYVDGQKVVDLWGNYGVPTYDDSALQVVFSSSKVLSQLAMAVAVDRGYFNYSDKVTKYWPEFGQNGKDGVTIEDVVKHQAKLAALGELLDVNLMADTDYVERIIEKSPAFEPKGAKRIYHAMSQGWVESGIIVRTDPKKRRLHQFLDDEVLKPLGIEFYLRELPEHADRRVHAMVHYPTRYVMASVVLPHYLAWLPFVPKISPVLSGMLAAFADPESVVRKTIVFKDLEPTCAFWNTKQSRTFETPSAGGISNARNLARIAQLLMNGGELDGVRILSEATAKLAHGNPTTETDAMLNMPTVFNRGGWGVGIVGPSCIGWGGWGGSVLQWCPEQKIAYSYTMNSMGVDPISDPRGTGMLRALVASLDTKKV